MQNRLLYIINGKHRLFFLRNFIPSCFRGISQSSCNNPSKKDDSTHQSSQRSSEACELPTEADVVVIGGGSVGCSTVYHLAKLGSGKVILLEKDALTAGTTWHTAGLLWRLSGHELCIRIVEHTRQLMTDVLPKEADVETGWVQTGGLFTAYTQTRLDSYKRMKSLGHFFGIPTNILSANEVKDVHPMLNVKELAGALYSPRDGTMDPTGACNAYTKAAKKFGAQIVESCKVVGLETTDDKMGLRRISAVLTSRGRIATNHVINCAGVWAPYISQMIGLATPQVTFRHAYVVTEPIQGIKTTPNVRDHDGSVYFKRQGDTLQVGGYESNPILCKTVDEDFAFGLYDLDMNAFGRHLEVACKAMPVLETSGIRTNVCGPESFTPDGWPLLGESPSVRGYFYGSGFNSGGMMWGGGAGKELALWAIRGRPESYMFPWDVRRFPSQLVRDKTWLRNKSHEFYAQHYAVAFPNDQPLAGRNKRKDPLHEVLLKRGCFYEERHGWERPGYFASSHVSELTVPEYDFYGAYGHTVSEDCNYRRHLQNEYTFDRPGETHMQIQKEALACRKTCALFDTSYMGKLVLTGRDATAAARLLFSRDVTSDVGSDRYIYTLMLNEGGGILSDLVVGRKGLDLKENEYQLIVGGATTEYCRGHVTQALRASGLKCEVEDWTEKFSILSLQGPKSRSVLQSALNDQSLDSLKYGQCAMSKIAGSTVMIIRLSFVGELGFEVHCYNRDAPTVYGALIAEVEKHGGMDAGYRAMDSLSTEAGYHHWGHSLRTDDTPLEARLMYLCDKADTHCYIGSAAIDKMMKRVPKKTLVYFTLDDPVQLFGHETIWKDDEVVGFVRSAAHGFLLNKECGMGYVTTTGNSAPNSIEELVKNGLYAIERNCKKHAAKAFVKSPFDPENERLRGTYNL